MTDLLSLVKELNSLNFKELSEKVIKDSEVEWCLSELQDMLEADCVPVVRCKYCAHWDGSICDVHSEWPDQYSTGHMDYTEADDFCSYGERKEGAE